MKEILIERHPLEPFLPAHARLLMLGSFPPQQKRWCMHFFYPNWINDMWRIMGFIFYDDAQKFVLPQEKRFDREAIIRFLNEKGIALYDTATAVHRTQDNAADKFLEIVETTDIPLLLKQIPECQALVTTGQKATETLCALFDLPQPEVGSYRSFLFEDREMRLYRMPSSSRAYPMKMEKKAAVYKQMMQEIGLL